MDEVKDGIGWYYSRKFGFLQLLNIFSSSNRRDFYGRYYLTKTKSCKLFELFRLKIIQAIIFLVFCGQVCAFYPSKCDDGYFGESENCIPCDSSCKTCSDITTCDSCENFMRKNYTTGLCEACPEGQYYDEIGDNCLPCNGVCKSQCLYQTSCFECPPEKILDINTLKCIDSCSSGQIKITSDRMNIDKICRTLSIYIDPGSQKLLELGTLEFPYRTFKSAASEIINHYSNTNLEVKLFIKDGFIEMDTFYFINMTRIIITAHPDYQLSYRRAQISFTSQHQHGISKKASFHLLKNTNINYNDVIKIGQFGEREMSSLSKINVGIVLARTNLEIFDVDIHSNELEFFCVPIYLQEKQVKLYEMDFNTTGFSFEVQDPMSMHLENITVDVSRWGRFVDTLNVFCNYPEAYTQSIMYAKTITPKVSIERSSYDYSILMSSLPGNHSIIDVDCGAYPINKNLDPCIIVGYNPVCVPDDDLLQNIYYDSINFDGRPIDAGTGYMFAAPIVAFAVPNRRIHIEMQNFTYYDIVQDWEYGLFYLYAAGSEKAKLSNFKFHNVSCNLFFMEISALADLEVKNFTVENSLNHPSELLKITNFGDIQIEDIYFKNFSNQGDTQISLFSIILPETSSIFLNNLNFEDMKIASVPLVYINAAPMMVTATNLMFKDAQTPDDQSLISFLSINSLAISNVTLENARPISSAGNREKIINIASLNLETMIQFEFSNFTITNSSLSLFSIGIITKLTSLERNMAFNNIGYFDCSIPTPRSLISTNGFVGDLNLNIKFNLLKFENVEFVTTGSLVEMKHQLPTTVYFENSSISRISSGTIDAEGNKLNDLTTKFKFVNSTFSEVTTPIVPFISTSNNLVFEISNSSFIGFTSMNLISGIIRASERSVIKIEDSVFRNNSAIVSPVFRAETEASIICTNCIISDNFGITNGVFEVASGAVLEIYLSFMYRNYAIEYSIGTFFSAFIPSIISGTQMYSNSAIQQSDLAGELSSNCSRICFLDNIMKDYLNNLNFSTIHEIDTLMQLLQAEVYIINNTRISNCSSILDSFSSTLRIENSTLFDIDFTQSPMSLVSTTATLNNLEIANCTKLNAQDDISFIQIISGTLESYGLAIINANYRVAQLSFSTGIMNYTKFTNVANEKGLIGALNCGQFKIDTLLLINTTATANSLISIQGSNDFEVMNIKLSGYQYKLAQFSSSNISLIHNLEISDGKQSLEFVESDLRKMSNCTFSNNAETNVTRGGAIKIIDSKITIEETTFRNNSAYSGGAIAFECTSMSNCELNIVNSNFIENKAGVSGGAIYYNYNNPRVLNTMFSSNTADYGPNFASYPAKIGISDGSTDQDITLSSIGSGITIEESLKLAIYDIDNQRMNLDNSSQIIILQKNASEAIIKGINAIVVNGGVAEFNNIAAIAKGQIRYSKFSLSSKSIDTKKVSEVLGASFTQKDLEIKFRDCQPGEMIVGNECEICAAGTYSLQQNSTECISCDLNAVCLGSNQVSVAPGHWRRFQNSTKIVECIVEEACDGGFVSTENSSQNSDSSNIHPVKCAEGYSGNLCSQCVVTEDAKYQRINDFECSKCPNQILNTIQVVLTLLVVLFFFILMVVINVKKTDESELSVSLRILANYLQLITVSTTMTNDYPAGLLTLTVPMRLFGGSTDAFMSFDCFITDTDVKFMFDSNAIFKLFLMIFLPVALFIFATTMWILVKLIKPKWVKNIQRNLVISFITIVFLLHPKLAEKSISMFKCVEIDEGFKVSKIDTNIECYSSTHLKWCIFVSIPILIIWVILCPLITFIIIYKGRKNRDSKIMGYFLMMYQGLKPEVIYWEFINTTRKIAILFLLLFELKVAINLSIIILLLTARLQIMLKPYKNKENNKIEFLSVMGGISIIMAALVYSGYEQHSILNGVVLIAVILINLKFLKEWLFSLLQIHRENNRTVEIILIVLCKIFCQKLPKSKSQIIKETEEKSQKLPKKSEKEPNNDSDLNKKKRLKKFKRKGNRRNKFKKSKSSRKNFKAFQVVKQNYGNNNQSNDVSSISPAGSHKNSERVLFKPAPRALNFDFDIDPKEQDADIMWIKRRVV
ncbi:unnamed protein product [Moneuplotes crassus]|uniref:Uncharacterized protein n=1 Tax=Euplotes crassus TaxID=5936 RepID=A0AAD1U7N0_EUPCR|nr:unnamed protein product [Moneuplotes crassus]